MHCWLLSCLYVLGPSEGWGGLRAWSVGMRGDRLIILDLCTCSQSCHDERFLRLTQWSAQVAGACPLPIVPPAGDIETNDDDDSLGWHTSLQNSSSSSPSNTPLIRLTATQRFSVDSHRKRKWWKECPHEIFLLSCQSSRGTADQIETPDAFSWRNPSWQQRPNIFTSYNIHYIHRWVASVTQ